MSSTDYNAPSDSECQTDFERILEPGLTRRRFLAGMGLAAAGTFISTLPVRKAFANGKSRLLGFKPVAVSTSDTFLVPDGYSAKPLISWGDPLFADAPAFDPSGMQSSAAQAMQFGDNTDGMSFFALDENRALLAVNNESVNPATLFSHAGKAITSDDVVKAQHAHGISIFEINREESGFWRVNKTSDYNRRIHVNTPVQLSGPAAGHPLLQSQENDSGFIAHGTLGNCANGKTPWGTYLTCEENFHDYFGTSDDNTPLTPTQKRYELKRRDQGLQWYLHDDRFDLSKQPNEANRFGWIVEIDPYNSSSVPKKRTALGRFAHENAAVTISEDNHVVVYMGDDTRGEHIYKFVSRDQFDPQNPDASRDLLDAGTLYVAHFNANTGDLHGRGEWIDLVHGKHGLTVDAGFADQAEVLINVRLASTIVGATTMDRPEWVVVHPHNNSVFCTLTNNYNRGVKDNQPVGGPNPRAQNNYGQIVRWRPDNGDHMSAEFDWDLFVIAGNPLAHPGTPYAGSENVDLSNMFNSPDGLAIDNDGRLWIQTDGDFSNLGEYVGMGNNQMLCADPDTSEIRRFATGPLGCELTGTSFSPDSTMLFVGVQHPGSDYTGSHFPGGPGTVPRSTIMMIKRDDGGVVGT